MRKIFTNKKLLIFSAITLVLIGGIFLYLNYKPNRTENKPPLKSEENSKPKEATSSPGNGQKEEPKEEQPKEEEPVYPTPPSENVQVLPEIGIGNTNKKQVIFTFDAGAGSQSASKILETLNKYSVKATFFFTGRWAEENQNLAKEIAAKNEVFNHTYSHPDLTTISDSDIKFQFEKGEEVISSVIGRTTKPYFRPPYGARNNHVLEVAAGEGYRSIYWTVDALDWKESEGYTAEQAKERILNNLKPGAIYLMHIGDNITGQILDEVFASITSQGYSIVSLTEGIK